ncbi:glycoside hydrolase family 6 protein [Streptomyces boncukensis]|uniref:Glucanase n=1 Tax=Streptomyces boncukensis TaxID=2711219 RepID=A0A6G4WW71_9ACTN|nr:glycoside hydrolase family 6 protein [Streptomyces boncukensis]NGO68870.1 glycoside hydrolase family 6 protein [Streptomyces boncukensis]
MYGRYDGRGRGAARPWLVAGAAATGAMLTLAGCSSSGGGDDSDDKAPGATKQRPKAESPYWVNPRGKAAKQVRTYESRGKSGDAKLIKKIAGQPLAEWIRPEDPRAETERVTKAAAKADRSALLVLYNIPHRDCGQYSKGGAKDAGEYRDWLGKIVKGIGDRSATVIVEPDSLPHLLAEGCTPKQFHDERYELLNEAVTKLKELPGTKVYLDAGNPDWVRDPGGLVEPLNRSGIAKADGFALNVSNFQTTKSNIAYGKKLSPMIGNKPFVIDTSRNGNGPVEGAHADEEAWCNPSGRALGEAPTTRTGEKLVDAYLWVKRPGESDGECKGGPKAGEWWATYALGLARNSGR